MDEAMKAALAAARSARKTAVDDMVCAIDVGVVFSAPVKAFALFYVFFAFVAQARRHRTRDRTVGETLRFVCVAFTLAVPLCSPAPVQTLKKQHGAGYWTDTRLPAWMMHPTLQLPRAPV